MRRLRVGLRVLGLSLWTVVIVAPVLVLLAAGGDRTTGLRGRLFRCWCRGVARLLGLSVSVEGRPPAAPFFLVSNHLGYLDIVTLGTQLPATFVSKAEVAHWPAMGLLARLANTVFIERGRRRDLTRVNARLGRLLDLAHGVIVFPEGTSTAGAGVLPFRPGLLEPAVARGRPVSFASLAYATPPGEPPASTSVCWWGDMTFGPHFIGLLGLKGLEATIRFGGEPLVDTDRRHLAERLHREVVQSFTPLTPSHEPSAAPTGTAPLADPLPTPADSPCTASET